MRLFIAIGFDGRTKKALEAVQERLRAYGVGSFTDPGMFHLTLVFLGEVPPDRAGALRDILRAVPVPELELVFDRAGCFRAGGALWWAGGDADPRLLRYRAELLDRITAAGFTPDTKSFRPHVTLARRVRAEHVDPEALLPQPFSFRPRSVSLMHSRTDGGRLIYTELFRVSRA